MALVLVVDDDPVGRELLHTLLRYAGHTTLEAADGAQALEAALRQPPDLVVADVLMPTMDGFEFVRRLREHAQFSATPVIFYSASYLEKEARHLAQRCGVTEILTKPCEPERMIETIQRALGQPQTPVTAPPEEEFLHEHVSLLTHKLLQNPTEAVARLKALVALGLEQASEHDPQRLLSSFCHAARRIIGAQYAVLAVVDPEAHTLRYSCTAGMPPERAANLADVILTALPERISASHKRDLRGDSERAGLPPAHPPVNEVLTEPVVSLGQVRACLYLSNRIGPDGFSEDDIGLARLMTAQLGRVYANAQLYAQVQRHMGALETEVYERKRAQEEVQQLNAELEQRIAMRTAALKEANEELEAFAQTVAHDLKAPLRAINGFSSLLRGQYNTALPSEGQRFLEVICDNSRAMNRLIEDLLAFSRCARQPLQVRTVNMEELVREVVAEVAPQHRPAAETSISIGTLPEGCGDRNLLRQVWVNLISNAFKYAREREQVRIEIGGRIRSHETVYFVRDNGAGFAMQDAPSLFTAFRRLHGDEMAEGEGVGLSICRRIVQRHGGTVWADGEPGRGATFQFSLPRGPIST